jgi:hypothetical protein
MFPVTIVAVLGLSACDRSRPVEGEHELGSITVHLGPAPPCPKGALAWAEPEDADGSMWAMECCGIPPNPCGLMRLPYGDFKLKILLADSIYISTNGADGRLDVAGYYLDGALTAHRDSATVLSITPALTSIEININLDE